LAVASSVEIIITRQAEAGEEIIAEIDSVEEIVIEGMGGGDAFEVHGDFTGTSLSMSTITLEGSEGDDIVDISNLTSAHRVVFRTQGGQDLIIGELRDQDVVELPDGKTQADY